MKKRFDFVLDRRTANLNRNWASELRRIDPTKLFTLRLLRLEDGYQSASLLPDVVLTYARS